jgi:hypothetical protein
LSFLTFGVFAMLYKSIHLAEQNLIAAREAFEAYKTSVAELNIEAAKRYWSIFLVSINGVFSKLELGAKCCNNCATWFGKHRHERKSDPLLHYIHHARNSEEHGLEEQVVHAPQSLSFEPTAPLGLPLFPTKFNFAGQDEENPQPAKITIGYRDGTTKVVTKLVKQNYVNRQLVLVKATSVRNPVPISPPNMHRGKEINGFEPTEVAGLAIGYFGAMVLEAKSLPCEPKTVSTSMAQ